MKPLSLTLGLALLMFASACSNRRGRNNPTVTPFIPTTAACSPEALFSELPGGCTPAISTDVAFGDLDGDGDLDAIVSAVGQTRLLLQSTPGQLDDSTVGRMPEAFFPASSIALVDVDGDGDLDACLGAAGQTRLYLNDGAATFTDVTADNLPVENTNTASVHAFDVDDDGDSDLLLANAANCVFDADDTNCTGSNNVLLINDGNGKFEASPTLPGDGDTRMFALGDIDGDGILDAFAAQHFADTSFPTGNPLGRANEPRSGNGSGLFVQNGTIEPQIQDRTNAIVLGDLDGDGDLDAFCANDTRSRVLLNDGTGSFQETLDALDTDEFSVPVQHAALVDLDGDMDLDLIVTGNQRPTRAFANDGSGRFLTNLDDTIVPTSSLGTSTEVVDLDGDGDLDIYVTNGGLSGAQADRVMINDGDGGYIEPNPARLPQTLTGALAIATGDINGDSEIDLAYGTPNGVVLFENSDLGVFADTTAMRIAAQPEGAVEDILLADFDRDGDLDIATAATQGPTPAEGLSNGLFLNAGDGSMTDTSGTALPPAQMDASYALGAGDVDADGDLDLVVGNIGSNRLYINDGAAVFTDSTSALPTANNSTEAIAMFDVDLDGDVDILFGNTTRIAGSDPQNRVLINDGTGVFIDETASRFPTDNESTNDLTFGDVDGDGDVDVFAANDGTSFLYINDGEGVFSLASTDQLALAVGRGERASFVDIDSDGDLDLLVAAAGQPMRILLNNGAGTFTNAPPTVIPGGGAASEVVTVDVDLDQDLDIVLFDGGQSRLLVNRLRQLDLMGMATLGGELPYLITAAPGSDRSFQAIPTAAILGVTPPVFVGDAGFLQVEALIANKLPPIAVGPPSNSTVGTLQVPNDTSLLGDSIFLQVILVEDGTGETRLTNLGRTPFVQ